MTDTQRDLERLRERLDALQQAHDRLEVRLSLIEVRPVQFVEPPECAAHTCSYFQHYLAQGPADLTHEGYHAAEKQCLAAQQKDMDYLDAHPDHHGVSPYDASARRWEKLVRA